MREKTAAPPEGRARWKWYGPAFIWMVSAVGSGEILFTPRVGSKYGYALLWAAVAITLFMWVMIREIGRYTVVTGRSILDGFGDIPGPANWAIWIIAVPQAVAAVVTIAGIAALVGSALMIAAPGSQLVYATAAIAVSALLVLFGGYPYVERIGVVFGAVLAGAAVAAAAVVFPGSAEVGAGLVPGVPQEDFDFYFVLPWVGFYLADAAGLMWFSYWTTAKGYGGGEGPDSPRRTKTASRGCEAGPLFCRAPRRSVWWAAASSRSLFWFSGPSSSAPKASCPPASPSPKI